MNFSDPLPPCVSDRPREASIGVTNVKVLAIASGGGHWVQLRRIVPAFEGMNCLYASTQPWMAEEVPDHRFYTIRDASRRKPFGFVVLLFQLTWLLLKERPRVVITTGSAPALVALALAKTLLRAKTIWIDSIANVTRMSSSGQRARYVADVWLTQWPHLAKQCGPEYWGAVI